VWHGRARSDGCNKCDNKPSPVVDGTLLSVVANLTERGFKWFFCATPVAGDFARAYSEFLKEQKAAGQKTEA